MSNTKKVISLVLALALVLGLGVVALGDGTYGDDNGYYGYDPYGDDPYDNDPYDNGDTDNTYGDDNTNGDNNNYTPSSTGITTIGDPTDDLDSIIADVWSADDWTLPAGMPSAVMDMLNGWVFEVGGLGRTFSGWPPGLHMIGRPPLIPNTTPTFRVVYWDDTQIVATWNNAAMRNSAGATQWQPSGPHYPPQPQRNVAGFVPSPIAGTWVSGVTTPAGTNMYPNTPHDGGGVVNPGAANGGWAIVPGFPPVHGGATVLPIPPGGVISGGGGGGSDLYQYGNAFTQLMTDANTQNANTWASRQFPTPHAVPNYYYANVADLPAWVRGSPIQVYRITYLGGNPINGRNWWVGNADGTTFHGNNPATARRTTTTHDWSTTSQPPAGPGAPFPFEPPRLLGTYNTCVPLSSAPFTGGVHNVAWRDGGTAAMNRLHNAPAGSLGTFDDTNVECWHCFNGSISYTWPVFTTGANIGRWNGGAPVITGTVEGSTIRHYTAAPEWYQRRQVGWNQHREIISILIPINTNESDFIRNASVLAGSEPRVPGAAPLTATSGMNNLIQHRGAPHISEDIGFFQRSRRPTWVTGMFEYTGSNAGSHPGSNGVHQVFDLRAAADGEERSFVVPINMHTDAFNFFHLGDPAFPQYYRTLALRSMNPPYQQWLRDLRMEFVEHSGVPAGDFIPSTTYRYVRVFYTICPDTALPPLNRRVQLVFGDSITINAEFMFAEEVVRIDAGSSAPRPGGTTMDRWTGYINFNLGTVAERNAFEQLPNGTILVISNISEPGNVNPRTASGTITFHSGTGLTRHVSIVVNTMSGTIDIPNAVFTAADTNYNIQIGSWVLGTHITVRPHVAPAPTFHVPNTWRIDGLSASGERRFQEELNNIPTITGDAYHRIPMLPSHFTWRIPNAEIPGLSGTGFQTGQDWQESADVLLHRAQRPGDATSAATILDVPSSLRLIHFDRVQLRTTRTVGMSGTIRDVEFHQSANPHVALRIRTPEFMVRTGTNHVAFDLNMSVTGASNRFLGRAAFDVANTRVYVRENQQFIDPHRREYLRAEDTIRNIDIYAGEGVTFRRNITRGQDLYVQASLATHDAWETFFQDHSELVDIILIHHTGMAHAASTVSIERPRTYYVFNSDRELIGTTADDDLPFSPVYFLTTSVIDIGGSTLPGEAPAGDGNGTGTDWTNIPGTGGDGGGSINVNYNPGTGR